MALQHGSGGLFDFVPLTPVVWFAVPCITCCACVCKRRAPLSFFHMQQMLPKSCMWEQRASANGPARAAGIGVLMLLRRLSPFTKEANPTRPPLSASLGQCTNDLLRPSRSGAERERGCIRSPADDIHACI